MVSKRILLAAVCIVVLVGAAGAYGYALYSQVSSLGRRLEDVQNEINLLKNRIGFINSSKTYNFFWQGPIAEKFNVTTFWMNITFQRINETHLVVTVETNNLNSDDPGCVGMLFDMNHDGELGFGDDGWVYYTFKSYVAPYYAKVKACFVPFNPSLGNVLYRNGQRFFNCFAECYVAGEHTWFFDSEKGYTYVVLVNLEELSLINDLIHVEYDFAVAVEFCFGMELIA